MHVTVLYRESGSGCDDTPVRSDAGGNVPPAEAGYNAFELTLPAGKRVVTVADVVKAFPLGPAYHFDVLGRDGMFESVHGLDLSSPVPLTADGVVTCRVFRLACPPGYASGGTGKMLSSGGGGFDPLLRGRGGGVGDGGRGKAAEGEGGAGGGGGRQQNHHHPGSVVQDLKRSAGKATKGLLGLVGNAVQRTAELLTHQEMAVGVYKIQVVKQMAEGGFSTVYLVRDTRTRDHLALKRMLCQERESTEAAYREVQVLRAVRHRNVVSLLEQVSTPSKTHPGAREFLLLFPYYERGTVWDAIVKASEDGPPWPYPEPTALRVFMDACCGVNAMHSHGFAHRDMKPLNLLVADDGSCVVMDVGSACAARREVSTRKEALLLEDEASVVCSAPYRPPELTSVQPGAVIDERIDVWALGCTLYAMAFGHSPFESPREGVLKLAILNGKFTFPRGRRGPLGAEYSTGFCDLISWMLDANPASRPRCPKVIQRVQDLMTRR